jgi:protein-disulfide isomerase
MARGFIRFVTPFGVAVIASWVFALTVSAVRAADLSPKLISFVQKRFLIPHAEEVTIGQPSATPIAGLTKYIATVTTPNGTARITLLCDSNGNNVIVGELYDTVHNPWGRQDVKPIHLKDRPEIGPANAAVTMVEFADFECPYCARSFGYVETAARSSFKDRVRFVFKHFPLNGHQWARGAAIAGECVNRQNPLMFWEYARAMYRDQGDITEQNLRDHVDSFVRDNNLDSKTLDACILGKSAESLVDQDIADGQAVNVTSTPTVFVNGIPVVGSPDDTTLSYVIGAELQSSDKSR